MSRGKLTLASKETKTPMNINPNYLEIFDDVLCITRAIRLAIELMSTKYFQKMNATIAWPNLKNCRNFGPHHIDSDNFYPSDRYLECLIRTSGTTAHHSGGTCAIGNNTNSPLNTKFQVRGIKGVRVIDASTLPTPASGTPHAIIVAVAEHASRIIIQSNRSK